MTHSFLLFYIVETEYFVVSEVAKCKICSVSFTGTCKQPVLFLLDKMSGLRLSVRVNNSLVTLPLNDQK